MSSYEYYRFETCGMPLTKTQQTELRTYSSRATITSNSFEVFYNYSSLNVTWNRLMLNYFDVGFYYTELGTLGFYFRFPKGAIPEAFIFGENRDQIDQLSDQDHQVLMFYAKEKEATYLYYDDEEKAEFFSYLIQLREDLCAGDYRFLYLYWLYCCDDDEYEYESDPLPLIKYDFEHLNETLVYLMKQLEISKVDVQSLILLLQHEDAHPNHQQSHLANADLWVEQLSNDQKNGLLRYLFEHGKLTRYMAIMMTKTQENNSQPTVYQHWLTLEKLSLYEDRAIELYYDDVRKKALAADLKAKKEKIEQLNDVYNRRNYFWRDVEVYVDKGNSTGYQKAVNVLNLLHEAYVHHAQEQKFEEKYQIFINMHEKRRSLMQRLQNTPYGKPRKLPL